MGSEFKIGSDIFECTQCGDCCTGFGGTYLTDEDIANISKYINVDAKDFVVKFCDISGSKFVLTQSKDTKCIFFDKLCTIHPVKPYMCKAWPFIKTLVAHPENWNAMANSCKGMCKDVPYEQLISIVSVDVEKIRSSYNLKK